jgi:single-strand DNA-binding protein
MAGELKFPRINTIIISGRLTRDVELRYTSNGKAVAKLSIAFDRSYQKAGEWVQESSYVDVTVWEKTAERCAEELSKGSPILVEGSLRTYTYQDRNNQNRKGVEISAYKVNFLEKSPINNSIESHPTNNQDAPESIITDDDVPF